MGTLSPRKLPFFSSSEAIISLLYVCMSVRVRFLNPSPHFLQCYALSLFGFLSSLLSPFLLHFYSFDSCCSYIFFFFFFGFSRSSTTLSAFQADERKTRSPVALKFLFDEAVHAILQSLWPINVDQAVHLAGLLMQVNVPLCEAGCHANALKRCSIDVQLVCPLR